VEIDPFQLVAANAVVRFKVPPKARMLLVKISAPFPAAGTT
jgi:hypothetical protein